MNTFNNQLVPLWKLGCSQMSLCVCVCMRARARARVCVCVCVWVRVRARVDLSKGLYARVCCTWVILFLSFFLIIDCLLAQIFGLWVWFSVCASVSSYSSVCSIDWLYSWQSCPRQFLRKKNYLYKSDKGCLMSLDIVL